MENKQQIVGELKELAEAELALVLDFKGLSIKEMSDLQDRLSQRQRLQGDQKHLDAPCH